MLSRATLAPHASAGEHFYHDGRDPLVAEKRSLRVTWCGGLLDESVFGVATHGGILCDVAASVLCEADSHSLGVASPQKPRLATT